MKDIDFSRIGVIVSLVALVVFVAFILPEFHFWPNAGRFVRILPWLVVGYFFWRFGGCCGTRCSSKHTTHSEAKERT